MDAHHTDDRVSLFFGSSEVNTFTLARDTSLRITRFSGATAKGLGQGNNHSKTIENIVTHKYAEHPLEAIVWMFGSVDCKFSYYHNLCTKPEAPDPDISMAECAIKYINFISHIRTILKSKETRTIVIGAEPNGAPPCKTFEQCLHYRVVTDTPENKQKIIESTHKIHPDKLRRTFNEILGCLCKKYGYEYVCIDSHLITPIGTDPDASIVKKDYTDIFELSTHLNWETNIKLYQYELGKINFIIQNTFNLLHSRDQYLQEKRQRLKRLPRFAMHNGADSDLINNAHNVLIEETNPTKERTRYPKRIKFTPSSS